MKSTSFEFKCLHFGQKTGFIRVAPPQSHQFWDSEVTKDIEVSLIQIKIPIQI